MLKDNLLILRNMHGFTQEQIAEKIEVSRQAYARWENGDTIPDIQKCSRIAKVYNVTIDSLINSGGDEEIGSIPPPPKGKNIWGSVTINERGQIVIPKLARNQFDLTGGQRLIVLSDEEGIALVPSQIFERKMQMIMRNASIDRDNE